MLSPLLVAEPWRPGRPPFFCNRSVERVIDRVQAQQLVPLAARQP